MVGFMKKRRDPTRRPSNVSEESTSDKRKSLRPSLSLPDLTTPLLDPSSWEEVPLSFIEALSNSPSTSNNSPIRLGASRSSKRDSSAAAATGAAGVAGGTTTRHRSPSVIKAGTTTPAFHRPFTPWQVVPSLAASTLGGIPPRGPTEGPAEGGSTDFRVSLASSWSRNEVPSGGLYVPTNAAAGVDLARVRSRRGKNKPPAKLNVAVVGGKGVGKTSFIRLLLDSLSSSSAAGGTEPSVSSPTSTDVHPPSTDSPGLPVVLASATPPTLSPTRRMSAETILVENPEIGDERTLLRIIDTPGLEISHGGDGALIKEKERERGVGGIIRLVEERYEQLLREERRVVRKKQSGDADVVHLLIYLIDARRIFRPHAAYDGSWGEKVDWSGVGVWEDSVTTANDDSEIQLEVVMPGISPVELEIIQKLSKRSNVLPVLTQIDGLSKKELATVRNAARRDLLDTFDGTDSSLVGLEAFESRDDEDPSDEEQDTSTVMPSANWPLAIFVPESDADCPAESKWSRDFPWGSADVLDSRHSDFGELQHVLFGESAKDLRLRTREVLYEKYRTERLLAARGKLDRG